MFKKKILIIDDTELMVKYIKDIMEAENYEVVTASDGQEGIRKVAEEKPDLVLLDLIMPGMNGLEVCKTLRANESNNLIPIIMLTSQDSEDDKLAGLESGADDYIVKPFNPRELLSRVRNTLIRIDRNRWANPLTGLQGNIEVQTEINHRIAKGSLFSVIYADLDDFKAYNDVYGFACGDRAIKLTADIISDNVHLFGTPGDFIGHVGGDDFIIITVPDCAESICKAIILDFDKRIPSLYTIKDRLKGFIKTTDRRGNSTEYPIMSVSLAVLSNKNRNLADHFCVAEIAAELKMKAKSIKGSVYVLDRRRQ
ncbi:MAG: response regulator [Acetivibrionales bacterium]